jgi:hypothetical protein
MSNFPSNLTLPEQYTNPFATIAWEYTAIAAGAFFVETALILDMFEFNSGLFKNEEW